MDLLILFILLFLIVVDIFLLWSCFKLEEEYDFLCDEIFGELEDENTQWNERKTEE